MSAGKQKSPWPEMATRAIEDAYDDLRSIAVAAMRGERSNHTLQATALANEACLRLLQQVDVEWSDKNQLRGVAAMLVRRVLADHARRHQSQKRGGAWGRDRVDFVELSADSIAISAEMMVELEAGLEELSVLDARQARIVELRYFGGMSVEDTAELLGISARTVNGDWRMARAWLKAKLSAQ